MNFIKSHWFGLIIWLWLVLFAILTAIVLVSPHHDAKNRGFAYCTQNLVDDLNDCNQKISCSVKVILNNTICDIKIIYAGITAWIDGKQNTPWDNYIFTPELPSSYIDEEERQEYLKEYPDTLAEMARLKILGKDLENVQDENINIEDFIDTPKASGVGLE